MSEESTISVTTGRPYLSPASLRYFRPSSPNPWNEYGDVRGLYAPPRSITAPLAATAAATSSICSLLSTAHGPAIVTMREPPTRITCPRLFGISTIVFSFLYSRLASLYGFCDSVFSIIKCSLKITG